MFAKKFSQNASNKNFAQSAAIQNEFLKYLFMKQFFSMKKYETLTRKYL